MRYLATYENLERGTFDFPLQHYYIDALHPRYNMPFHWHHECELIRVRQGVLPLVVEGELLPLRAGDCAFISGGIIHGGQPNDAVYECLVLDMDRLLHNNAGRREQYAATLQNGAAIQRHFPAGSPESELLARLFDAMAREHSGYEFTVIGLLWQWLGAVLQHSLMRSPGETEGQHAQYVQLKNVLRRIRNDYAQPLTLSQLAAEAQLTPQYFCRMFRRAMGKSPVDYLNYYRVECASEMLRSTDNTVTDIALACGFNDLNYFIRIFRKYKGSSPNRFRNQGSEQQVG